MWETNPTDLNSKSNVTRDVLIDFLDEEVKCVLMEI